MYSYHFQHQDHSLIAFFSVIEGSEPTQWEPGEPAEIEIETDGEGLTQIYMEHKGRRRILPEKLAEKVEGELLANHYDEMLAAADDAAETWADEHWENRREARQEVARRMLFGGRNDD